jgi:hypothetical protein
LFWKFTYCVTLLRRCFKCFAGFNNTTRKSSSDVSWTSFTKS